MIERFAHKKVEDSLKRQAAVALVGPRQVGKTTLALEVGRQHNAIYLDLENDSDRAKLSDPRDFLLPNAKRLVILDEIHRVPELFSQLRGIIDEGRRQGAGKGRFLLLGSASLDLLKQSSESLAGRVAYIEMTTLSPLEVMLKNVSNQPAEGNTRKPAEDNTGVSDKLWLRGGFPDSFLAETNRDSFAWRTDLIRTYLERDVAMFAPRVPAETMRRLWTMLAYGQATMLNASNIARSLEISSPTVQRYIDLLVDLLLVRRLQPYTVNLGKRLVRTPKVFIRDSGLLHALLAIDEREQLLGHPVVGASWEGFVIESLMSVVPERTVAGFYRTSAGAEVDLVLELPGGDRWAIEVKRSVTAKPSRGFYQSIEDLKPQRAIVVHANSDKYAMGNGIQVIGFAELSRELKHL